MHKHSDSTGEIDKKIIRSVQKINLQDILKERSSSCSVSYKYNNIPQKTHEKQFSSQATQIQEDLLDNGIGFRYDSKDENDDEYNSLDISLNQDENFMQSRYSKQCEKNQEAAYFIRNQYINKQYNHDGNTQPNKSLKKIEFNNMSNRGFTINLNSLYQRYPNNIKNQQDQPKQQLKSETNSTYMSQIQSCQPHIHQDQTKNGLYTVFQDQTRNDSKKRLISINHKEVYKVFRSKQQEEEIKNKFYINLSNNVPSSSCRSSQQINKFEKRKENCNYQIIQKPQLNQHQRESISPLQNIQFQSLFNSRKPSLEESKFGTKNWNLAELPQKLNLEQDQPYKKFSIINSQIYKQYQSKLNEKLNNSLTNIQQNVESFRISDKNKQAQGCSLKQKNIQLNQLYLQQNKCAIDYHVGQDFQPKRYFQKFFSSKQFSINSPKIQTTLQNSEYNSLFSVKQLENRANSQQRQQKQIKKNNSYSSKQILLKDDITKRRINTIHTSIENNEQQNQQLNQSEENNTSLDENKVCNTKELKSLLFYKQVFENYYK